MTELDTPAQLFTASTTEFHVDLGEGIGLRQVRTDSSRLVRQRRQINPFNSWSQISQFVNQVYGASTTIAGMA